MKNSMHALIIVLLTTSQLVSPAAPKRKGYSGNAVVVMAAVAAITGAAAMKLFQSSHQTDESSKPPTVYDGSGVVSIKSIPVSDDEIREFSVLIPTNSVTTYPGPCNKLRLWTDDNLHFCYELEWDPDDPGLLLLQSQRDSVPRPQTNASVELQYKGKCPRVDAVPPTHIKNRIIATGEPAVPHGPPPPYADNSRQKNWLKKLLLKLQ